MQSLGMVSLVVADYDEALAFYVGKLGFTLVEDSFVPEQNKRWVVIEPPGAVGGAKLLLARGVNPEQTSRIGNQTGGRAWFGTPELLAEQFEIQGMEIRAPLVFEQDHLKTLRFALYPKDGSFTIESRVDGEKHSFSASTCSGWIANRPLKPMLFARSELSRSPSGSRSLKYGVSSASTWAARAATHNDWRA
jgi:catechol 2,3-dioxygenase-like lactoylglutathione lyase family enzyme